MIFQQDKERKRMKEKYLCQRRMALDTNIMVIESQATCKQKRDGKMKKFRREEEIQKKRRIFFYFILFHKL